MQGKMSKCSRAHVRQLGLEQSFKAGEGLGGAQASPGANLICRAVCELKRIFMEFLIFLGCFCRVEQPFREPWGGPWEALG